MPTFLPSRVTSRLDASSRHQPHLGISELLAAALTRRRSLIDRQVTQAFRVFSADADGLPGVFIDVYASAAVLIIYEGATPAGFDAVAEAPAILDALRPLGVRAIYLKPFAKDRSKLGGSLPACVTDPTPAAGECLAETLLIREHDCTLEIRPYDGLSTGLFLDQRENRRHLASLVAARIKKLGTPPSVLNTFAYTCAFSAAAAKAGAITTSVDISGRYIDWGKRNFEHNGLDVAQHRFAKMDTFEFFDYAGRKGLTYDLIILDPPSFGSANKKRGTRAWSSLTDYARLVRAAASLLSRGGLIFASTNTTELCRPGRLDHEITKGLGHQPRWLPLPDAPIDFARERDRFAARLFLP